MPPFVDYVDNTNPNNEMSLNGNADHDATVMYYVNSGQATLRAPSTGTTVPLRESPPKVEEANESGIPSNATKSTTDTSQQLSAAEIAKLNRNISIPPVNTTTIQGITRASIDPQTSTVNTTSLPGVDAASKTSDVTEAKINETSTIPNYVVSPNMLHDYASYTYNISLHALTPKDYTYIMDNPGEDYKPTAVLIASGGRWGDTSGQSQRHAEFRDVDFFFDNLSLETIIGMTAQTRNTNAVTTNFTIIEPYGVTLLNRIMNVCSDIGGQNFREMPYLLQIDFFGYKDDGIPTKIPYMTKMIPIRFMEFKIKLSTKGAEYAISAYAFNHTAYSETIASTPTKLEVVAATVGDFFLAKTGVPDEYKVVDDKTVSDRTSQHARITEASREVDAMEKKRIEDAKAQGLRGPPAKSEQQLATEAEVKKLQTEVLGALKVHSYTGAVNAWHEALKTDKKIKYAHTIKFEIDEEIAKATFPEAQFLPPAMSPMAATVEDVGETATEIAKTSYVNTTSISGITAASDNKVRVAPAIGGTVNAKTSSTASTLTEDQKSKIVSLTDQNQTSQNGLYTKIYSGNTQTRIISLNQGTSIIEVIGLAIRSSSYITSQLADPVSLTATPQQIADLNNKALNWFKITPRITLLEYDTSQNTFAKCITYKIEKYVVYNTKNQLAPQGNPQGYVKAYDYMYTGQNKDIVSLDINFDSLYYVAQTTAAVNNESVSGAQVTTTDRECVPQEGWATESESNKLKESEANGAFQATKSNLNTTTGEGSITNKDDLARQVQKQLLTSPSGDMLSIKLKIIGDPDFIKQDDCFYSTPTLQKAKENEFKLRKGGSLVMDLGEIFVNLTFKTPGDYNSQGLAIPGYEKYNSSIFSGRYKVLTVKSTFSGGKFEQELDLVYFPNQKTQGIDTPPKATSNDQRETQEQQSDSRVDNSAVLSGNFSNLSTTLLGTSGVSLSESDIDLSPFDFRFSQSSVDDTVDTILKEATARRNAANSFPTFALGSDSMQDQMSTVRANASAAASEATTGFSKIAVGYQSVANMSPASSKLSTALSAAQSSSATAVSSSTLTPTIQTGTGGRF